MEFSYHSKMTEKQNTISLTIKLQPNVFFDSV